MHLSYELEILFLVIYPKEMKTYDYKKSCRRMITVSIFIITPNWKQPGPP